MTLTPFALLTPFAIDAFVWSVPAEDNHQITWDGRVRTCGKPWRAAA